MHLDFFSVILNKEKNCEFTLITLEIKCGFDLVSLFNGISTFVGHLMQ